MKKPGEHLYPDDEIPEPRAQRPRRALERVEPLRRREEDPHHRRLGHRGRAAAAAHHADASDATRTILARNTSPDVPFDRSINPYRGCEHGCIYCFARPTHAYLGLSPGLDFETKILFKPDAAKLLTAELASPKYRPDVMAMGTNTDPYQPVERELKITRSILRVLSRLQSSCRHRHQEPPGDARHRHPGRHGQAQPGRGLPLGHHARQGPGAGRWSRAPRRRIAGSRRSGRWPTPACRSA